MDISAARPEPIVKVSPTRKGFVELRKALSPHGWRAYHHMAAWRDHEQKVFNSNDGAHGGLLDAGLTPGLFRTRRNVSLALRYANSHLAVMEEIIHPGGVLVLRHECGADIDKAAETFSRSIDELEKLEYGSMPELLYEVPREWLGELIAYDFRNRARHETKALIRERQRQVELEAQVDIEASAAAMMVEAGFDGLAVAQS